MNHGVKLIFTCSVRPERDDLAWLASGAASVLLTAAVLASSCAMAQTPGERFRKTMEDRKRYCATHEMRRGEMTCDILKLGAPTPLATPEGRFAHSIKLPAAAEVSRASYRAGMSSEEYFDELCGREAGELIFRTVDGVDGVL